MKQVFFFLLQSQWECFGPGLSDTEDAAKVLMALG